MQCSSAKSVEDRQRSINLRHVSFRESDHMKIILRTNDTAIQNR